VFGRFANIEAAERLCRSLAPADQLGHTRDGVGAVLVGEVGHELHRVAVEDHRLFAFVIRPGGGSRGGDGPHGVDQRRPHRQPSAGGAVLIRRGDHRLHQGAVFGHPDIDLAAEVAGAALAAALVVAVENWGRNGCTGDLGEITATALNLVRSGLAPLR
jgi:hypothetical protein